MIGLIIGSLFYHLTPAYQNSRDYFGAAFLFVSYASLCGMSDLSPALSSKAVWFKMRDCGFYPAWVHATAAAIVSLPHQAGDFAVALPVCKQAIVGAPFLLYRLI